MITIVGATGQTGGAAAERLLDSGEEIRAVGRSAERLGSLADRGAETAVGDVGDAAFLARAFTGADAVYLMVPPDYHDPDFFGRYDRIGRAMGDALGEAGVPHAVFLSSVGAELPAGTGPIVGLHRLEAHLRELPGLSLLILRAGYFYENHLTTLELIKHQGMNGGAEPADVAIPMIAAADIGGAAAAALRARDFAGVEVRELAGPRDLTMRETTRVIGERIGKPDLPYVQFAPEPLVDGLIQSAGFPRPVAELFLEMGQAFEKGLIKTHASRTPATTGPTTFEAWVENVLVPAYREI